MGDTKHIRLAVRFASQKDIQDVIHRDFTPGVHSHKYPKGADRNSVTVEVVGDVDAGKLYDRLKKIASSVEIEIESVIPAKMKRLEEDLKSEIKTTRETNQLHLSKIESLNEDKENLHRKLKDHESEIKSLNEDKENLHRKLKDHESEIKSLNEDKKNLHRKIEDLEYNKGGRSVAVQGLNNLIIERHREHDIKRLKETIEHLNSNISTLEEINKIFQTELGLLKQQLGQLKI